MVPISVAIIDDHELVRRGLKDLIESDPELQVIAQAANVYEGFNVVKSHQPDVAIVDVRMPDGNGVELCREILSHVEGVKVIMLTSYADDEALLGAILAGASGYVLKDIKGEILLKSIHKVGQGESILDKEAADRVRARLRKSGSAAAEIEDLSEQELKIISYIGDGLTNRQISEQMFIAEKTVKNYVSSLFSKLGLENRTQAATLATRVGLRPDSNRNLPSNSNSRF